MGTHTQERYLNPTNDIAFKKLFGTEEHLFLLKSFLNAILNLKEGYKITDIDFLSKEQIPLIKDNKYTILDIKCTDQKKNQYIVEMQNQKVPVFTKRVQFYAAQSYASQLEAGVSYQHLKPVILLCIANHTLFPDKQNIISYHQTRDIHTNENDLQDISYVFIELKKFNKTEHELFSLQDKWIYFFKSWKDCREVPSAIYEEELVEAYRSMEKFNWTQPELEAYLKARLAWDDECAAYRKEREEGLTEGLIEGKAEGLAEGKAEGLAEGLTKGKAEGLSEGSEKEKIRLAQKLLKKAMSMEEISELTGLSSEKIEKIDSELSTGIL